MPEDESWSSEDFGWFVRFEEIGRPSIEELKTWQEKCITMKAYFESLFEKLEELITPGIRIYSKQEFLGTACIIGDEKECLELKTKLEDLKLAIMIKNNT